MRVNGLSIQDMKYVAITHREEFNIDNISSSALFNSTNNNKKVKTCLSD